MINLRKALQLIELLDPYIPESLDFDASILEFVGKILSNIVERNRHADYLAAVVLLTDIAEDDLVQMTTDQVFILFTEGLIENQILTLVDFYRGVRKKIWQTKTL